MQEYYFQIFYSEYEEVSYLQSSMGGQNMKKWVIYKALSQCFSVRHKEIYWLWMMQSVYLESKVFVFFWQ
jgi:hypothetical protein